MSVKNILKLLSLSAQMTYTNLQKLEQVDVAASSSNVFALSKREAQEWVYFYLLPALAK